MTLLACEEGGNSPCVLLGLRGKEPHKDQWSLPGGGVRLGETVDEAAVREMKEETGLVVVPAASGVVTTTDSIHINSDGKTVKYHYLIAQVETYCILITNTGTDSSPDPLASTMILVVPAVTLNNPDC